MLLPALNKARETARKISCANNLSQIGRAVMLYTVDNHDRTPPYRNATSSATMYFIGGSVSNGYLALYLGLPRSYDVDIGLINKDISSSKKNCRSKFACPSRGDTAQKYTLALNRHTVDPDNLTSIHMSRLKKPSLNMLMADNKPENAGATLSYYNALSNFRIGSIHSNGANVLYLDWHVAWGLFRSFPNASNILSGNNKSFWEY